VVLARFKTQVVIEMANEGGVTTTEEILYSLCQDTFLRLWSYANPFKDDGKEFCDLIAVFEDHVSYFLIVKAGASMGQLKTSW